MLPSLPSDLRTESPYWASKYDDANQLAEALREGHLHFTDMVGGDGVPGMIRRLEEDARHARNFLEFLARLPTRQKR